MKKLIKFSYRYNHPTKTYKNSKRHFIMTGHIQTTLNNVKKIIKTLNLYNENFKNKTVKQKNKQSLRIVKNLKDFKKLLKQGYFEFRITLNGGVYSKKEIFLNSKTKKFEIYNSIDDTYQKLTEKQLMDQSYTNIGKALEKKALVVNLQAKI